MDEVTELVDWIQAQNGKPVDLHRRFSLAVVNVLWTLLSGQRYAHDDPKLMAILDQLETYEDQCDSNFESVIPGKLLNSDSLFYKPFLV